MLSKKRSPLAAIVLAVVIGLLVIALLNGVIRPTQVVVAKVPIAAGTILTDQLVELHTIPMGAKPAGALASIEDVTGKMLANQGRGLIAVRQRTNGMRDRAGCFQLPALSYKALVPAGISGRGT